MSHTIRDKQKLKARTSKIQGQVVALKKMLDEPHECAAVLQQIAAIRGTSHVAVVKTLSRVRETARRLYPALWAAYHDGEKRARRESVDILETLFKNEF